MITYDNSDSAPAEGQTPENVIEGNDGWLFLGEGSNYSISQMTGHRTIDSRELNRWIRILQFRARYFGNRYRTIICPEKSVVLDEFLPDKFVIEPDRASTKLRRMIPDFDYPIEAMKEYPCYRESYPQNDTHMSDPMTAEFAKRVIEGFDMVPSTVFETLNYENREIMGDLGGKYSTPRNGNKAFVINFPTLDILDSGLVNRGRVMRYTNTAIDGPSLLIFGDSFSAISLARFLCLNFRTVHFVHSAAVDYILFERLSPDFILGQYAERFLLTAPVEGLPVASLILEKMFCINYTENMISDFLGSLEDYGDYISEIECNLLRQAYSALQG